MGEYVCDVRMLGVCVCVGGGGMGMCVQGGGWV